MPFRQRLDGLIEPNTLDFKQASPADKKWFYAKAGDVALERMKKQLSRGIGANGRQMKPRIRAVLPGGFDGQVMEPRYDHSRVITLSDYMATNHSLLLFWHAGTGSASHRAHRAKVKAHAKAKKSKKRAGKLPAPPIPFNRILAYHAEGLVPHAPVRDVRLSSASIHQIRIEMGKLWAERQRQRRRNTPPPRPQPRPRPMPTPYPRPGVPYPPAARGG